MTSEAKGWWRFAITIVLLAAVFAGAVPPYLRRYTLSPLSVAAIYCCFVLLLILVAAPAMSASRTWIERYLRGRASPFIYRAQRPPIVLCAPFALIALWCAPYLIYAAGTRDFKFFALLRLVALAVLLIVLYVVVPVRDVSKLGWQDVLVAVALIWAVLSHQMAGIWNVPVNLDFMTRLFLISVAAWSWVFLRRVPGLGYQFSFSKRVIRAAALNFACFAVIAAPLGFALHFIQWNPRWRGIVPFALDYIELFLFVAWLEELFFRGFLQTLISNSLRSPWRGQLIVSVLFGFSHILHAPVPNWRYVLLASIAGWFYGAAFRSGGTLVASSLIHALVDTAWRTWFVHP